MRPERMQRPPLKPGGSLATVSFAPKRKSEIREADKCGGSKRRGKMTREGLRMPRKRAVRDRLGRKPEEESSEADDEHDGRYHPPLPPTHSPNETRTETGRIPNPWKPEGPNTQ